MVQMRAGCPPHSPRLTGFSSWSRARGRPEARFLTTDTVACYRSIQVAVVVQDNRVWVKEVPVLCFLTLFREQAHVDAIFNGKAERGICSKWNMGRSMVPSIVSLRIIAERNSQGGCTGCHPSNLYQFLDHRTMVEQCWRSTFPPTDIETRATPDKSPSSG